LNKIRILENDEQKKTNPNSNEAFELGFVDSLRKPDNSGFLLLMSPFLILKVIPSNLRSSPLVSAIRSNHKFFRKYKPEDYDQC
ncbi:hypothetical protein, partial [Tepidibacillus fermentans]|uniref:hypothetical protein n=1 Tax=Tepidibacillus fermentans TaxID=1281767 RepID=UPI001A9E1AEF